MSDYGALSRVLHGLALGVTAIAEASFDAEQAIMGRDLVPSDGAPHVFVTGLARSGTTVLMRAMFASGEFCSLTYRDMPFVLAPGLWSRIAGERIERQAAERAHGDGVMVDFDSPEAFDEVFWRIFCGPAYIRADRLLSMRADAQTVDRFRRYVALIQKRYRRARYLSKNNNNILRIGSLLDAFPSARIIVPFREPLQQAVSLLRQHRRFRQKHRDDRFSERYMRWLVHHEFGADHRPFEWGLLAAQGYGPDTLDYWLAQWVGVYGHLLQDAQRYRANVRLLSYETLCSQPQQQWRKLTEFIGLRSPEPEQLRMSRSSVEERTDNGLLARAEGLHGSLLAASMSP
jgi:hypothetical protein